MSDCIEWNGCRDRMGYGKIGRKLNGQMFYLAHRYFYTIAKGPIPDGLVLDHLCRNHSCINPDHLEPVSNKENILRGVGIGAQYANRDECKNGHPFGESPKLRSDGGRRCLTCEKEVDRARSPRRRAKV